MGQASVLGQDGWLACSPHFGAVLFGIPPIQARPEATDRMAYSSSWELEWRLGFGLLTGGRSFSKNSEVEK